MGGARNLKLGAKEEGKGQGTEGNNFLWLGRGPNVDLISVVVCIEKM